MFFSRGRYLLPLFLFILPAMGWGDSYDNGVPAELRDRWQQADEAYQQGDYDRAAQITAEILNLRPDYADALSLEWKIAEKKKIVESSSHQEESDQLRQEAQKIALEHAGEKKKSQEEEERQRKWREQEKESIQRKHLDRGKKLLKKGELSEAIGEFQQVLEIDSSSPLGELGHRYRDLAQKRLEEIKAEKQSPRGKVSSAKKAVSNQEKADDLIRMAWEAKKVQQYTETKQFLQQALSIDPLNKIAKKRLADIEAEEYQQEIRKLEREQELLNEKRELDEARMLLEVAKAHELPPQPRWKRAVPAQEMPSGADSAIRKKLGGLVSADFEDVELRDVIEFLSKSTGANIILAKKLQQEERKITAHFKQLTLEDVLNFLAKSHQLVYRVEQEAVWITSQEDVNDEPLQTRIYFLNQGLGIFPKFTSAAGGSTELGQGASVSEVKTIKDILEEAVPFSGDAKLVVDERTGALIVSNTPANLELIERLIANLDRFPIQVLIEARFVEVNVTDLEEIGTEFELTGDFAFRKSDSLARGNRGQLQNITQITKGGGVNFADFSRSGEGFNLTYQGILTYPEFQWILHAIEERETAKTLSAPRITTLNNQTASIEVVDQFIYPTRYEVELIQFDINGDGDFNDAGETEFANVPKDFVTRDVGILLKVTPSVGGGGKNMTLSLLPEVSSSSGNFTFTGGVTIPKFTLRQLQTSVFVNEGETVVMGGLVKESSTVKTTKVPLLGNIPLFGKIFQRHTESLDRRNLLIFVTPKVLSQQETWVKDS